MIILEFLTAYHNIKYTDLMPTFPRLNNALTIYMYNNYDTMLSHLFQKIITK